MFVYIVKLGDGFIVHDAGETVAVIMAHGQSGDTAKKIIKSECKRYGLSFGKRRISLKIEAIDWLETAIVSVANTCAMSARNALKENSKKTEQALAENLYQLLEPSLPKGAITKGFPYKGASGRRYKFDLAVQSRSGITLIETVTAHAISVNSKYVALADVPHDAQVNKIVAHNNDLSAEDILLLQNVATVAGPDGVHKLLTRNVQ
ncbi:hypothetical protein [Roseovarius tolerans]|uniref:hypothetical protein n=1 Tax=Roseovarius tolerans TaxID=74031 RepID=UPI00128CA689|nr:hypothetical protein [Roseovarius tolerans]